MSGCGARTAAGSLEAVFKSSDVERFGWILMEVSQIRPRYRRNRSGRVGLGGHEVTAKLGIKRLVAQNRELHF